jgi:hypothetical protein
MATLKKLAALLGAGALVFALAGTAIAASDPSDEGVVPTTIEGNITLLGGGGNDQADCDAADGIETGNTGGSDTTENGVEVTWTWDGDTKEFGFTASGGLVTIAYVKGGSAYNEYDYTGFPGGGIASDGSLVAPENGSGGPAGLSHAVFCTVVVEESEPPSFEASEEAFTEPPSDAFGAKDSSGPADGAWLLVVALGVLLASIVVLTPARAKSRR